jgi:hypothetical protein
VPQICRDLLFNLSFVLAAACWPTGSPAADDDYDRRSVGVQPDGRIIVPTNQILKPAGMQIVFPGRPVDLAFADDGRTLVVKNRRELEFIDCATGRIKQTLKVPSRVKGKPGFSVVGLQVRGERVYASDTENHVQVARRGPNGSYDWEEPILVAAPKVKDEAHPAGIAFDSGGDLWVTSTRGNNVQRVNLQAGKIEEVVTVGVAPYSLCFPRLRHPHRPEDRHR